MLDLFIELRVSSNSKANQQVLLVIGMVTAALAAGIVLENLVFANRVGDVARRGLFGLVCRCYSTFDDHFFPVTS